MFIHKFASIKSSKHIYLISCNNLLNTTLHTSGDIIKHYKLPHLIKPINNIKQVSSKVKLFKDTILSK